MLKTNSSLIEIEWPELVRYAAQYCKTTLGKKNISLLAEGPQYWSSSLAESQKQQDETQEVRELLFRESIWNAISELQDPYEILDLLRKGHVLDVSELLLLSHWCKALKEWSELPSSEFTQNHLDSKVNSPEKFVNFFTSIQQIPNFLLASKIFQRVLTPEGEISERASSLLASLTQEVRSLKREIENKLHSLTNQFMKQGFLQEDYSDVRDGKYVLPVKVHHQSEVEGHIFESSATGQTVFVEPKEISILNQKLRQKQSDYKQELFRILKDTSQKLVPFIDDFILGAEIVTHWDQVYAKAVFANLTFGQSITLNSQNASIDIQGASHPLLWLTESHSKIVKNNLSLHSPYQALLITGPNTGGKTVFLKTIGLAAVCARTGFTIPASNSPIVPFFDQIFTDLGDYQSIEEHVSSFSGHVRKFKAIIENATSDSLVLLDEMNSATDPEEGAALSRALLEELLHRGSIVIGTTHDPKLKVLSVNHPKILTASMEFNERSLLPTYRVIYGVPGRSRALETARRLGLSEKIIQNAEAYLSNDHKAFEESLSHLQSYLSFAKNASEEALEAQEKAKKLKIHWEEKSGPQYLELLAKFKQRIKRIQDQIQLEAQETVRSILSELKSSPTQSKVLLASEQVKEKLKDIGQKAVQELEHYLDANEPDILQKTIEPNNKQEHTRTSEKDASLKIGEKVRVLKWKSVGTIVEVFPAGRIKVSLGALQVTLLQNEYELLPSASKPKLFNVTYSQTNKSAFNEAQLDLRGKRFEEAMSELQLYLDQMYRSKLFTQVYIIHGYGTGALREGTKKLLKKLNYVRTYTDAPQNQGGTGATVVEFDF